LNQARSTEGAAARASRVSTTLVLPSVDGKYLSIVDLLGGGVSTETNSMRRADPKTIGTTGKKPKMVTFAVVRSKR